MFNRTRQGAIHVISGEVPLTTETAAQLTHVLDECLQLGPPQAVVDLRKVPLLDSRGLEALLDLQDRFVQRAGALNLAAPNTLCNDILSVTGVADHFEVYPELKAAIASFLQ